MNIAPVTTLAEADRQALRDLIHSVGWNDAQADGQIQSIAHFLQDPNAAVYFARDEARIAAFLTCQFYAWNCLGQIHGLVVDPACRRLHLATRLVERGEQFLRGKGARGVYVDTPVDNAGGRRFYEAAGYRVGYIMPEYYAEGQDGVTYQKFFHREPDSS